MEDAIKVAGKTANNMETEPIKVTKIAHPEKECGRMVRESNGRIKSKSKLNDFNDDKMVLIIAAFKIFQK